MKLLQLMLNLHEARGIKDDLYYIITGGRKVDLYTERGFKSSEAAEKYLKAEHDDAHDSGVYDHGLDSCEVMRGAALKKNFPKIFEAGRTFTIKNDAIKGRGAPEEKARAFDKVNPKTGARPNRSVLKKMQKDAEDFFAIQGEEGEEYTMCLVMSAANSENTNYYGVNVLFFPDGHVEASTADRWSDKEWKNHRARIVKVARDFLKKDHAFSRDIEGPMTEGERLGEAKDPAAKILMKVAKALRALGFTKDSVADTPGVKRQWLIQKKVKYSFDSASFKQFVKDLGEQLPDEKLKSEVKSWERGEDHVYGKGFTISTQNDDQHGQVVVSVPKSNSQGDRYRQGYDA